MSSDLSISSSRLPVFFNGLISPANSHGIHVRSTFRLRTKQGGRPRHRSIPWRRLAAISTTAVTPTKLDADLDVHGTGTVDALRHPDHKRSPPRAAVPREGAMRSQAPCRGKISPRCIPEHPAMAGFCPDAFPTDWQWQDFAPMRSQRALGREKRQFVATYRRRVSKTSWFWQDSRAMHSKSAANRLPGMHSAQILPGRDPFRRTGPSNHARRAVLAIRRSAKPPERPHPTAAHHPRHSRRQRQPHRKRSRTHSPAQRWGVRRTRDAATTRAPATLAPP